MKIYQTFLFKFFVFGLAAMIIVQCGILLFVGNVYLSDNAQYVTHKVETQTTNKIMKTNFTVEDGVKHFYASFDGKYVAYEYNHFIKIVNLETGTKKTITANNGMQIVCFKWIYDRDRLLIAEKRKSGSYFKLYSFDTSDKSVTEVIDNVDDKSIKISVLGPDETVSQIEMSTLTNLIYLKIAGKNSSRLYKINIMAQKSSISMPTHHIGNIALLKNDDIILYENTYTNKVYDSSSEKAITINKTNDLKLIGADNSDNVYIAPASNNKTSVVYYGDVLLGMWQTVKLPNAVNINDLYLTSNGELYCKNSSSSLLNIKTGKTIKYKGSLRGVYDFGFLTQDGNKVTRQPFH